VAPEGSPPPLRDGHDEAQIMTTIREAVRRRPDQALALIDAADQAHPHSPLLEERAALRVDALVNANQIGRARDIAEEFLVRYPDGTYAEHVEVLTGVHPRPPDTP
jgi:hypothetical protein